MAEIKKEGQTFVVSPGAESEFRTGNEALARYYGQNEDATAALIVKINAVIDEVAKETGLSPTVVAIHAIGIAQSYAVRNVYQSISKQAGA